MLAEKRKDLILVLNELIKKYSNNTLVKTSIIQDFEKRNINPSKGIKLLTGAYPFETLDINEDKDLFLLFVFTKALSDALTQKDKNDDTVGTLNEYKEIQVNNYFTKVEVNKFEDFVLPEKEKSKYPYVLKNMLKLSDGHFVGIIPAKELIAMDAANDIIYNFATQRDPKIDMFGLRKINIDKTKIKQIMSNLLEGTQFPHDIKLNVLKDGTDQIDFKPKDKDGTYGNLIIYDGTINIFDGYHNKTALVLTDKENPEILESYNCKLTIINFSEKKAEKYMVQIDKQTKIDEEYIRNKDTNIVQNVIVDYIIDDEGSELGKNIKNSDAELKVKGLTKKSILTTAIEEQYPEFIQNTIHSKHIANWIVEFTNRLIGLYIDDFLKNPKQTKEISYINNKNMFIGYIALSRRLYEQANWIEQLKETMSKIDFNKQNELWKNIGFSETKELNKSGRNALYKLFKEGV